MKHLLIIFVLITYIGFPKQILAQNGFNKTEQTRCGDFLMLGGASGEQLHDTARIDFVVAYGGKKSQLCTVSYQISYTEKGSNKLITRKFSKKRYWTPESSQRVTTDLKNVELGTFDVRLIACGDKH